MVYVIFPAYNEERVIGPTLRALAEAVRGHEADYHAVLVDDGSADRTVECAREAVADAEGPALTVLRHERNMGLGAGLRTGIYWCLDHGSESDIIVTLDADNTQPPSLIPTLVAGVRAGHDLVIASRYRTGSEVHGVPWYRRLVSDGGRLVCQAIYPIRGVRDYTCCFRAFGMPILRRARAVYGDDLCTARGFEAVIDLLLRLGALNVKATEIGFVLNYGERVGQSKMKVLRTIGQTLKLLGRRRLETFLPHSHAALARGNGQ